MKAASMPAMIPYLRWLNAFNEACASYTLCALDNQKVVGHLRSHIDLVDLGHLEQNQNHDLNFKFESRFGSGQFKPSITVLNWGPPFTKEKPSCFRHWNHASPAILVQANLGPSEKFNSAQWWPRRIYVAQAPLTIDNWINSALGTIALWKFWSNFKIKNVTCLVNKMQCLSSHW